MKSFLLIMALFSIVGVWVSNSLEVEERSFEMLQEEAVDKSSQLTSCNGGILDFIIQQIPCTTECVSFAYQVESLKINFISYSCHNTSVPKIDGTLIYNNTKIVESFCSTNNCNKGEPVDNNKLWCNFGPFDSDPTKTKGKLSCSGSCIIAKNSTAVNFNNGGIKNTNNFCLPKEFECVVGKTVNFYGINVTPSKCCKTDYCN